MNTRFEILVEFNGEKYSLDTFDTETISLNYNIADIRDISKRNSSYSKTIRIPETSNNRNIFSDIGDLNVDSSFNPNKKTKAYILVDSVVVIEGYLQLRNVVDNISYGKKEYEVVIFAENDNFIKEIGEGYLTDLDFTELNHTWSSDNIVNSWTQSWSHGYYYPLIDYGYDWPYSRINGFRPDVSVKINQIFPSTNVKYILDKIFDGATYSYQSDFLNSNVFKDLYIPFNNNSLNRDEDLNDKFSIGMVNPITYTFSGDSATLANLPKIANQRVIGTYRIPFDNENTPFGDPGNNFNITTHEYTEDGGIVSQRFICDFDVSFQYHQKVDLELLDSLNVPTTHIVFKRSRNPITGATVNGGYPIPVNGSTTPLAFTTDYIDNVVITGPETTFGATGVPPIRVRGQIATDFLDSTGSSGTNTKLFDGEKVWVEVKYSCRTTILDFILILPNKNLITFNEENIFFNLLSENLTADEFINYNKIIPENIKQKDFFNSLVKMFNLYIEPSKEYDRTLVIEPRDQFYVEGVIKDWTNKLDINQDIQEVILGETQDLKTIFKYKDDNDYYNEDYREVKAGISYGEYEYEIDNDFVKGEKTVQTIFSPTPLVEVPGSPKLVIPKIGKLGNNNLFSPTQHNIRILTKYRSSVIDNWSFDEFLENTDGYTILSTDGISNTTHNFNEFDVIKISNCTETDLNGGIFKVIEVINNKKIVINISFNDLGTTTTGDVNSIEGLLPFDNNIGQWGFDGNRFKTYPYLGHFNNPFEPNYDLNFGQTIGLYYPEKSVTDDNLYSVYWQNYMDEINDKNSKIITAYFYLTADDIASFKFNDNIFINGQYYKVNKIEYDPTTIALSRVELIKSLVITVPKEFNRSTPTRFNTTNGTSNPIKIPTGIGNYISSNDNDVVSTNTGVFGNSNQVFGTTNLLNGSGNTISSSNNFVSGNDNKIKAGSNNNKVLGSNNEIKSGVNNTTVIGDDMTVTDSNIFSIGVPVAISPNYISASENEVLNDNSTKLVNYISASRNSVREKGTADVINIISGGRFE